MRGSSYYTLSLPCLYIRAPESSRDKRIFNINANWYINKMQFSYNMYTRGKLTILTEFNSSEQYNVFIKRDVSDIPNVKILL